MIATLRKLTRKSTLKVGKHKDLTVQRVLDLGKKKDLVYLYFNTSNMTFMDDILDELRITEEFRISKPSKSRSAYNNFLNESYYYTNKNNRGYGSDKLIKRKETLSKAVLKFKNQKFI